MPKLKSRVLADEMRAKIESGEWPAGTKMPSRSQLLVE
jgi:DNA-binding GntR family transcriptional regulator